MQGRKGKWLIHLSLIFAAFFTVGPFVWMGLTAFKSYDESIRIPLTIWPEVWRFDNFVTVWNKFPFPAFYFNTFFVMAVIIICQIAICSIAAYAFARLKFPGNNVIFLLCLSVMMVPGQIFIIPHYEIMMGLNLINTITALWLPRIFSVFGVFMLKQFFMTLPRELDEAAKIDGCGYFTIYARILMPLIKPALISLAILTGLGAWKDLMWPLIINTSMDKYTLSAGLALLIGEHTTIYPLVMAGGIMAVWPMILLFLFFQKYFIEGIALSGTKA